MTYSYNTYLSTFSWRYGSQEMRTIWSEENKRMQMRRVWVALATAQHQAGLVSKDQLDDLKSKSSAIDIDRALEIEKETRHDVMAEIRAYAEQCPLGGKIIHLGATSADVNDNVYALRIKASAALLKRHLSDLLLILAPQIKETAHIPVMAHTHIQPAEPTTLGYRFAVYGQDLLACWQDVDHLVNHVRGKGFKGAVGTQASYAELLEDSDIDPFEMERIAMDVLDIPVFPVATQTYTRQQDLRIINVLSTLATSMHKWAMDFRVLQSPPFGEWAEPFGKRQVGSSAMPFKRNPINTENICSLARYIASLPGMAWDNASQAILERSLDDSANRRIFLAEGFLAADEMVRRMTRVVKDMVLDYDQMQKNLEMYGPFAATERVLMGLVSNGGDRQEGHEWLREQSLVAWEAMRRNGDNPLTENLAADGRILEFLSADEVRDLMSAEAHIGTAPQRAEMMAAEILSIVRPADVGAMSAG